MKTVDVLVVGAGPGGAAAAKKCADNGLKTLLIEKQRLPRRKACSGIIDNLAQNYVLENFAPIPAEVFGEPHISRGMAFYFPSVGTILADVDCFMPYVWRDRFDHWLARTSGAELRDETRFLSLEEKGDEIEATLKQQGKIVKVRARYLIGADGGHSRIIRTFAPEVYQGLPWAFACQKYYEGEIDASDRHLYWFLTPNLGPFPWLNMKDGQIIIGLAVMHGEPFHKNFDQLLTFLKRDFGLKIKKELAVESCLHNLMTPLNRFFPGRGRVLMVGDAMGLMHQGHCSISAALASGGLAGTAVTQGINQGTTALTHYKELIRPELEICLDQFNPLRFGSTIASSTSRQPKFFHGLSRRDKARAIRDALVFLKSEFGKVDGIGSIVLSNVIHRLVHGKYDIPAVRDGR